MTNNTPSYQQLINHTEAANRLLSVIAASLKAIEHSLTTLEQSQAPLSPNYRRRYQEYPGFNWQTIGAKIIATDPHGAAEVEWSGHRFDRTVGEKYNEKFIIFSRPTPEWTQTNKTYHTLIKFADYNKTPLDPQPKPDPTNPPKQNQARPPQPESEPPPTTPQSATRNPQSIPSPADYRKQESRRRRTGQTKQPTQPNNHAQPEPPPTTPQSATRNPQSQIRNPQSADPQSAIPNPQSADPLLAEAQQVTDAASFYALVNRLIPQDKTIIKTMKPIIENAATTWTEKAVLLIGG